MAANHVTDDIICVNLLFIMDRLVKVILVKFRLDLFSHFREEDV